MAARARPARARARGHAGFGSVDPTGRASVTTTATMRSDGEPRELRALVEPAHRQRRRRDHQDRHSHARPSRQQRRRDAGHERDRRRGHQEAEPGDQRHRSPRSRPARGGGSAERMSSTRRRVGDRRHRPAPRAPRRSPRTPTPTPALTARPIGTSRCGVQRAETTTGPSPSGVITHPLASPFTSCRSPADPPSTDTSQPELSLCPTHQPERVLVGAATSTSTCPGSSTVHGERRCARRSIAPRVATPAGSPARSDDSTTRLAARSARPSTSERRRWTPGPSTSGSHAVELRTRAVR